MAFFFRNKPKADIVKPTRDLLVRLWQPPKLQKTEEEVAKLLATMKQIVMGIHETDSTQDHISQVVNSMIQEDFLYLVVHSLHLLPFGARKDSQTILSYSLRFRPVGSTHEDTPILAHIIDSRPEVVVELCRGYARRESATPCGVVLRELLKNEHVAAIALYDQSQGDEPTVKVDGMALDEPQSGDGVFWKLFEWIDKGAFEVSTDAFNTFKDILTKHKRLVSQYLTINFDLFFKRYHSILISSGSYVTKRTSIKLLGELLLDRANYNVMTEYVDRGDHLKLCMNLLRDDRKMVQYEAFHVFKVFVANPHQSSAVRKILIQNRDRLSRFLRVFLDDRTDDDQFLDEKAFLIRQIEALPAPSLAPS